LTFPSWFENFDRVEHKQKKQKKPPEIRILILAHENPLTQYTFVLCECVITRGRLRSNMQCFKTIKTQWTLFFLNLPPGGLVLSDDMAGTLSSVVHVTRVGEVDVTVVLP